MSDNEKVDPSGNLYFEPSTIETIDKSVRNYIDSLKLFTTTNKGWQQVPVLWGTSERAYLTKNEKEARDNLGALVFPIISIRRTSFKKDLKSPGVFQGNIPEVNDEQGSSVDVRKVIYQEKTTKFASADAKKLHGQSFFPRPNAKVVYRTVSVPMPVNVEVSYEITIRTEYQQQMNDLMLPFITKPGTINFVSLVEGQHRYEGFINSDFQNQDNLTDYSSQERKFETKVSIRVVGYLVGEGNNRDKPSYAIRENAVEVKIPRERISLQEIPEHEYGNYYGLSGIPAFEAKQRSPFASFFSNVPAAGGGAGGGGGGLSGVSGNIITVNNFSETLANNLVIREVLRNQGDALSGTPSVYTVTGGDIQLNTETLFLNGMILAVGSAYDYTISNNTITINDSITITENDTLYITYILGS